MKIYKLSKTLLSAFLIIFIASCSNPANDFNERMALNFLDVMSNVDSFHEHLKDGNKTSVSISSKEVMENLAFVEQHIKDVKLKSNELQQSSQADAFRAQVLHYMDEVKTEYYPAVEFYISAPNKDLKSAAHERLMTVRNKLTEEENKTLEIQKKFLSKADIAY